MKLLSRGVQEGFLYVLNPVSSFRYFEFDSVASSIPAAPTLRCFDASSPRLFSIWLASTIAAADITVINPDSRDIRTTAEIIAAMRIDNCRAACAGIEVLASHEHQFDFIYSISVIEHIAGDLRDGDAMQLMWNALKPGGTLAVTFPVDRGYREEYRDRPNYGPQASVGGRYFFQRYYDQDSMEGRLLVPIGLPGCDLRFYGERSPGIFANYEKRWIRDGIHVSVEDPRIMANNFSEYPDWARMPGCGVCALRARKPG